MLAPRRILSLLPVLLLSVVWLGLLWGHGGPRAQSGPSPSVDRTRILITGDSITQGAAGDYTWRYWLWKKLAETAPGQVRFVGPRDDLHDTVNHRAGSHDYAVRFSGDAHGARPGTTVHRELGTVTAMVTKADPDVVVVLLGSNDLAHGASPAKVAADLATYVRRARAARPGVDVVLGVPLNRLTPGRRTHSIAPLVTLTANRLESLANRLDTPAERVVLAPTYVGWRADADTWDGTHPTPTGERLIAQRFSGALAILGIGWVAPNIAGSQPWQVPGPTPHLRADRGTVRLGWDRTRSGATEMIVERRPHGSGAGWTRSAPVAGDGWTERLPAGTYDFRLVPVKGSLAGVPGPVATVVGS